VWAVGGNREWVAKIVEDLCGLRTRGHRALACRPKPLGQHGVVAGVTGNRQSVDEIAGDLNGRSGSIPAHHQT